MVDGDLVQTLIGVATAPNAPEWTRGYMRVFPDTSNKALNSPNWGARDVEPSGAHDQDP